MKKTVQKHKKISFSKILKDKNKGAKPYNDTLFLIFIITHYMFICQVITNIL